MLLGVRCIALGHTLHTKEPGCGELMRNNLPVLIALTVAAEAWMGEVSFGCFAGAWQYKQVAGYSKFGLR